MDITSIIVAILFLGLGFVFGITLGFMVGIEVKARRDKKRQSS